MTRILLAATALAAVAAHAAAGDLIPSNAAYAPMRVKLHKVETTIDNQIAITRVVQIFENDSDKDIGEAVYVFPTPAGATIVDFAMTIDGKMMRGELLEKNRARDIYEGIVRKAKDPGLLEQVGKDVFRMRVFPIRPRSEQKIELTYVERITYHQGRCTWRYPLKVPGSKIESKTDRMQISVRIASHVPIKEVVSATHPFDVARATVQEAAVTYDRKDADLSKDVELTYTLAREKTGFDVVAHRAGADGYFALLVTPSPDAGDKPMPKDMTFVFDTSGSMEGDKIKQARAALKYCISRLNPQDRFNIVDFNTGVSAFRESHAAATDENRAAAETHADRLEAAGSTNIQGAFERALAHKPDAGRPHIVLFLTDGLPTVGEQDPLRLRQRILDANTSDARIFTFGVGDDVSRGLLEDLAETARAVAAFVAPKENIETSVAALQRRIVAPVLEGIEIDWGGADVHGVYPKRLTDVYAGVQLLIAGRYGKPGTHKVKLKGRHAGKEIVIEQAIAFPEREGGCEALKYIWGARRIADLLDTIRRTGETTEIVADVVRLSREYRVATPYTSFLVLENEAAYDAEGIDRKGANSAPPGTTAKAPPRKPRPIPDMEKPRDLDPNKKILDMKKSVEDPVYKKDAVESDHSETADDGEFQKAKGDSLDFVTDKPFKGKGTHDTLGAGGGGGRYGVRLGDKRNLVERGCGSALTEDAVQAALKWLARHQEENGSWTASKSKCGKCVTPGEADFDTGVTALSLLAFLGAGYTHLSRDVHDGVCFGDVVKKAIQWLISQQDPEGCIGPRNVSQYMYNHAIAAMALAEAYGLTGSNLFKDAAQRSIDFLVAAQNPGKGWRYSFRAGDNDSSVTAWALFALKSAELAGLTFDRKSLDGARAWFDECTDENYGRTGYTMKNQGKMFVPGKNDAFSDHPSLTAAAVLSRILVDKKRDDKGAALILKDRPQWKKDEIDFLYWHHATLALFQHDGPAGENWKSWNERVKEALTKNQRIEGCARGSWEPVDRWSHAGGRVYASAMNALTLEVYYRYANVFGVKK